MYKYKYILLSSALFLASHNGLMLAEQPDKACIDANKHTIKAAVADYILAYVALYGTIPVASAGAIMLFGDTALNHSFGAFKALNYKMSTSVLKSVPITALLALTYNSIKKNISQ